MAFTHAFNDASISGYENENRDALLLSFKANGWGRRPPLVAISGAHRFQVSRAYRWLHGLAPRFSNVSPATAARRLRSSSSSHRLF